MPNLQVLSAESLAKVNADHERLLAEWRNTEARLRAFMCAVSQDSFGQLGYTAGGITAMSSGTPGTGTVQLKRLLGDTLSDDGPTVTVRSWTPVACSSATWVWVTADKYGTLWWTEQACT